MKKMLIFMLLITGILLAERKAEGTELRFVPDHLESLPLGSNVVVDLEMSDVLNLHSAQIEVRWPDSLELVDSSVSAGVLWSSNGGTPMMFSDQLTDGVRLSAALLGMAHDVSGNGNVFSFSLIRVKNSYSNETVTISSVSAFDTSAAAIPVTLHSLSVDASTPVIMEFHPDELSGGGALEFDLGGINISDLHSLSLMLIYNPLAFTFVSATETGLLAGMESISIFELISPGQLQMSSALLGGSSSFGGDGDLFGFNFSLSDSKLLPSVFTLNVISAINVDGTDSAHLINSVDLNVISSGPIDADNDGLPDSWELDFFNSITNAIASVDSDGDGHSNLQEYITGMDPTNAASCFIVRATKVSAEGFVVSWDSVDGRSYTIGRSDSLTNTFSSIISGLEYPQSSYTDTVYSAESSGFYRISVELD